jgi:hypothetical protein
LGQGRVLTLRERASTDGDFSTFSNSIDTRRWTTNISLSDVLLLRSISPSYLFGPYLRWYFAGKRKVGGLITGLPMPKAD